MVADGKSLEGEGWSLINSAEKHVLELSPAEKGVVKSGWPPVGLMVPPCGKGTETVPSWGTGTKDPWLWLPL